MPALADLLSFIDSSKRAVKSRLSDLIGNPGGYAEMVNDQLGNYNNAVQPVAQGGSLYNRPLTEDEKNQRSIDMALNVGPMGVGHIAYHGSPHKFDKFSLDKIGTGEGAQAYGHGLYFAENERVAKDYAEKLALPRDPTRWAATPEEQYVAREARRFNKDNGQFPDAEQLRDGAFYYDPYDWNHDFSHDALSKAIDALEKKGGFKPHQNLYKTDIPDEAVSRFLDWDKPLSQQAPEVRAAVSRLPKGWVTGSGGERRWLDPNQSQRTGAGLLDDLRMLQREGAARRHAASSRSSRHPLPRRRLTLCRSRL